MASSSGRRNKRRRCASASSSLLLLRCREAQTNTQLLRVLRSATVHACREMVALGASPVVQAILIAAASATMRNGVSQRQVALVAEVIEVSAARGIDPTCGCPIAGTDWELPLVLAAFYGMREIVAKLLVDHSAAPDSCNSEGVTCWHAAFCSTSSYDGARLAPRDLAVIDLLIKSGCIEKDLCRWAHSTTPGSCIFVGCEDRAYSTVLSSSVFSKNFQAAELAVQAGAKLSDMDFRRIYMDRKARREITKLLPIVAHVELAMARSVAAEMDVFNGGETNAISNGRRSNSGDSSTSSTSRNDTSITRNNARSNNTGTHRIDCVRVWRPAIDWSFPPEWHRGVRTMALCLSRKLLPDLALFHIMQFCGRSWFLHLPRERERQRRRILGGLDEPLLARLQPGVLNRF